MGSGHQRHLLQEPGRVRSLFLTCVRRKCSWEVSDALLLQDLLEPWDGFSSLCIHASAAALGCVCTFYGQRLFPHWEQELLVSWDLTHPSCILRTRARRHRQEAPVCGTAQDFLPCLWVHLSVQFRQAIFNEMDNNQDLKNAHLWSLQSVSA